ncbi:MAG: pyridoxal-phosphate dependent enzyme [Patescibacteria group bacterium]
MKRGQLRFEMKCIKCGESMPQDKPLYTCIKCGGLLMSERDEDYVRSALGFGALAQARLDSIRYSKLSAEYPYGSGVFRYWDFILPGFPKEAIVSLREGNTDLLTPPEWLRAEVGLKNLYIKMEGQNPSGSFKDRGMCVAISEVNRLIKFYPELGIIGVACASTGDTAAAAAAYAAEVEKMKSLVFMAHGKVAPGHLVQSMRLGALLFAIDHKDGFDGAMRIVSDFCNAHPEFVLVNSKNPFRPIGQEAIALEIFQDLNWKAPDYISVPAGNGGNLTALMMSCLRAKEYGLIDRLPGIIIAQPEVTNTLVRWKRSEFKEYAPGEYRDSVASAMNITNPVSFPRIEKLYGHFEILAYDVSEERIQDTRARFKHLCPHGSVAMDAVLQAREDNKIREDDKVVVISTASDLKFSESNFAYHSGRNRYANPPKIILGKIEAIEKEIGSLI